MLREQRRPPEDIADEQGAVVLILEDGLHNFADDVAVAKIHPPPRHDDEGEVLLVGQRHELWIHFGHEHAHVEEDQPHLSSVGQAAEIGALGFHIPGDVEKAGDDNFTAKKLIVAKELRLEHIGVGILQH